MPSKINECVGRIVKGVNTTPDVGVDQIEIEAKKFGIEVNKDGKPKYDYSHWIKSLSEEIINTAIKLTEEDLGNPIIYGRLLNQIESVDFKKVSSNSENIIYENKDYRLVIHLGTISPSLMQYQKFCQYNPFDTNSMSEFKEDVIYFPSGIKNYSKRVYWWIERKTKECTDIKLKDEYIAYSNYIIHEEDTEFPYVDDKVRHKIDNLNFTSVNPNNFVLDYDNIRYDMKDDIVFVDCFKGASNTKKSLNVTKQALKSNAKYPEEIMDYLEQNNFTKEGSGLYASTYSSGNIVIKITRSVDNSYLDFVDFCKNHKSPHLPKLGKVRHLDGFYIIPMEKLSHTASTDFDETADFLSLYSYNSGSNENSTDILDKMPSNKYTNQIPELMKLIDEMEKSRAMGSKFDLHRGNFMTRGNTIVIIDPFVG